MQKELNILNLLCINIINRFDELEEKGLIFHKQKQKGKQFIKELEKLSDVIIDASENKADGLNELHIYDNKLNEFLDTL